jgi:hypothetical protein
MTSGQVMSGADAFLNRGSGPRARSRRERGACQRKLVPDILQTVRWTGRAQFGDQIAEIFQSLGGGPEPPSDPFDRAEQVRHQRHAGWCAVGLDRLFEQEHWPGIADNPAMDFSHVMDDRDPVANASQLPFAFDKAQEI